MANYKPVNYALTAMIPVDFSEQILLDTFEYTLYHLVEDELRDFVAEVGFSTGSLCV